MGFSHTHLITLFLVVFIPYVASLKFNYTNIDPSNQNRDIVSEGKGSYISNEGIQVTPNEIGSNRNSKAGRAKYIKPLHLWDNGSGELASFSTSFTFVIDSKGQTNYGDGLTFFLAEDDSIIGLGGSMGLPVNATTLVTTSRFVAVEFDTYSNTWDPKVWDATMGQNVSIGNHVGISISSLTSVRSQKWLSDITRGAVCQAWIRYDSVSNNLSVSFTGFQNNTVVRQDGLVYSVDLRKELPEWVIFGFSAATGASFEKNNVRSWTFDSSDLHVDKKTEEPVKEKTGKVGLIIVGLSVLVILLSILAFVLWRRKKKKIGEHEAYDNSFDIAMDNEFELGTGPKRFFYQELAHSTSNFAQKLGHGGFGDVYKGSLKDPIIEIAVKRVSKTSKQGRKEYASEVKVIRQLGHRNLVPLIGWCHEKDELMLVYEYMENGSLDLHLFKGKSSLTWDKRYKIAHGLASALLYLHEECKRCVLHRDIKSSNVMLDSDFNAKLGDFGMAKLVDHGKGSDVTMLAGTFGYMAPEYISTNIATKESDVYSFGVVALEIACGRKSLEYKGEEESIQLVKWVWKLYETKTLLEAVDPSLESKFNEEEIKRLLILGLWCVHPDSKSRPSMKKVIKVLNFEDSLPLPPPKMPEASYLEPPKLYTVSPIMPDQSSSSTSNTESSKQTTSSTNSSCSSSTSLLHSMQ